MPITPIVVIHGNPASNLWDLYLTQPDAIYTLTQGGWPLHAPSAQQSYNRLPIHPDDPQTTLNTTGSVVVPARIGSINPFYLPYEDLVENLKKEVDASGTSAPVFPFTYDWRYDSLKSAADLSNFITEVLRITSLLPAYKGSPATQVDIVAHSFGGLVTARYLSTCQAAVPPKPTRVRKVVTIGTPFQGAVDAMFAMIKEDYEERQAARTLPSVYGLLPYFVDATMDTTQTPPVSIDLLTDPNAFAGSSVERSLDAYCQAMGSSKTGTIRLQELRNMAVAQRTDIANLNVIAALGSTDNWLPIVGIQAETYTQIEIVNVTAPNNTDAEFQFVQEDLGGDNTVPFAGAIPPFNLLTGAPNSFTPIERLVCFSPDDIGLREKASWMGIAQIIGKTSLHAFLPQMNAVQAAIVGFLRDVAPKVKAQARPAPGIAPANVQWSPNWNLEPA